jgi:hypothetical protein
VFSLNFYCFLWCRLLGVSRVLGQNFSIEAQSSSDKRLGINDGSPSHSWQHSLTTTKLVLAVLKVVDGTGTKSSVSQPF